MSAELVRLGESEQSQGQRVLPEQKLLEAIFGLKQRPISQESSEQLRGTLNEVLYTLNPRYQEVLTRRFGLFDAPKETLREIAKSLRITRERIRQIENQGLMRIRSYSEGLRGFLTLPETSVAYSIANLNLTYGDLKSVANASLWALGTAGALAQYVAGMAGKEWENIGMILVEEAQPFFNLLSENQIKHLGGELREVYELGLDGYWNRVKEQEKEGRRREEERLVPIVNLLFPEIDLPPELPAHIVNTPIENLNLETFIKQTLLNRGVRTVGDVLRKPKPPEGQEKLNTWGWGHVKEKIWDLLAGRIPKKIIFKNNLMTEIKLQNGLLDKLARNPIDSLNLPLRVKSALLMGGLKTIGQILGLTREDLLLYRNIGPNSLLMIESAIRAYIEEITT